MNRSAHWLLALIFAATVLVTTGPVMRETDQASLIDGAWRLKHGVSLSEAESESGFYRFDLQFLTYAIASLAVADWELPLNESQIDHLVARLNFLVAGIFIAGAFLFCYSLNRCGNGGVLTAWLAFLSAPVVLFSAPLASSAVMSAGFLLMLAAVLNLRPFRGRTAVAGFLALIATACRADAVLCMPILCWATVRPGTWKALLTERIHWVMAGGCSAAVLAGRWFAGESTGLFFDPYFMPRIFFTTVIFGMSGMLFLAAGYAAMLIVSGPGRHGYRAAGVLFFFLPLLFYSGQLFSPRHLLPMTLGVLILAAAWRGRALRRLWQKRKPRTLSIFAAVAITFSVAR